MSRRTGDYQEGLESWMAELPSSHMPSVISGSESARAFDYDELARKTWGDINDDFNQYVQIAREKGWMDKKGNVTSAGRKELLRIKNNRDVIADKKPVEVVKNPEYQHTITPKDQANSLLTKYQVSPDYSVEVVKDGGNYVLKLIRENGKKGFVTVKEFKASEKGQLLDSFERYLTKMNKHDLE